MGTGVGTGMGIGMGITKLVYQIGFTTPSYVSRARKYFGSKQQQQQTATAAASSKQNTFLPIRISPSP